MLLGPLKVYLKVDPELFEKHKLRANKKSLKLQNTRHANQDADNRKRLFLFLQALKPNKQYLLFQEERGVGLL